MIDIELLKDFLIEAVTFMLTHPLITSSFEILKIFITAEDKCFLCKAWGWSFAQVFPKSRVYSELTMKCEGLCQFFSLITINKWIFTWWDKGRVWLDESWSLV